MTPGPNGDRIGPYEIQDLLGSGGMGVVYRAWDHRLGRRVAIKVLLPEVTADVEALRRFEREVRAVAALSHPNILGIYDFQRDGESVYAVMELLTGGTLRERLDSGPMPPRKAVEVGIQIARGLAAAHEQNFVHRDLKPENIAFTRDGRAKILDFGLARESIASSGTDGDLPTRPRHTTPGLILGTLGYMSPEQVRGQEVDPRSDLFALGAILHEMMTGRRAFGGDTAADTMSAILNEDIRALSDSGVVVPPVLDRVVRRCLEKHPGERFHSARDLAFALENSSESAGHPKEMPPVSRRSWLRAAVLVGVGLAVGAGLTGLMRSSPSGDQVRAFEVTHAALDGSPSASPDGSEIAFASTVDGTSRIYRLIVESGAVTPLTAGRGRRPRYFPDGRSLVFLRQNGRTDDAVTLSLDSGVEHPILNDVVEVVPSPLDGLSVAFLRFGAAGDGAADQGPVGIIGLKAADGAGPEDKILAEQNAEFASLDWSSDGRDLAAIRRGTVSPNATAVVVVNVDSKAVTEFPAADGRSYGALAWVGDGRHLVVSESMTSQAFVPGAPGQVLLVDAFTGSAERLFYQANLFGLFGLVDSNARLDVVGPGILTFDPMSIGQTLEELSLEPGAGEGQRLTYGTSLDRQPAYSPSGDYVVFTSNRSGNLELWLVRDGATHRLTEGAAQHWDPGFASEDVLVWSSNRAGHFEILKGRIQFDPNTGKASLGEVEEVTKDGVDAQNPTVTESGWVIYKGGKTGEQGLWKVRLDGTEPTLLLPGTLLGVPDVSPNGRYVLVRDNDRPALQATLRVVDVETGDLDPFEIIVDYTLQESNADITRGRARWKSDDVIMFIGQDADGTVGIYEQDFTPGRVPESSPRLRVPSTLGHLTESFDVSADGTRIVVSFADYRRNVWLARDIPGILPTPPGGR